MYRFRKKKGANVGSLVDNKSSGQSRAKTVGKVKTIRKTKHREREESEYRERNTSTYILT